MMLINLFSKIKMKFLVATALATVSVSGQELLDYCKSNGDCMDIKEGFYNDGCCMKMELTAVADEPNWGAIKDGVFKGQDMKVGDFVELCMPKGMVDCRNENGGADGTLVNTTDLQCFLDNMTGACEALELADCTAESLIDTWGSDIETNDAMNLKTTCKNAVKVAASGIAMIAAVYSTM